MSHGNGLLLVGLVDRLAGAVITVTNKGQHRLNQIIKSIVSFRIQLNLYTGLHWEHGRQTCRAGLPGWP